LYQIMEMKSHKDLAMEYEVKIFKGLQGLMELESVWRTLTNEQVNISFYQRFEWYYAYLKHLEQLKDNVIFFLVIESQNPIAIIPLKQNERSLFGVRLRVWETPRTSEIDLYDFVAKDEDIIKPAFHSVIQTLKSNKEFHFDAIWLSHVLEGGIASNLITNRTIKNTVFEKNNYSKYLSCYKDGKISIEFGTGKFRRNLRRLEKRLNEKGEVVYQYKCDIDDMRNAYPMFLDVEASGWKGEDGTKTAIKYNESAKAFYSELLDKFGESGKCRINLLQLDGNTIAAQYCLVDHNKINLLKIGHDPQHQDTSPGFLLIKKVFEDGCGDESFNQLSFVTGSEWNDIFRPEKLGVFNILIFNVSIKGLFVCFLTISKNAVKNMIRRDR
jgi:CelD/BcsL family acetyltransferase involved in cellulose biosynthesis